MFICYKIRYRPTLLSRLHRKFVLDFIQQFHRRWNQMYCIVKHLNKQLPYNCIHIGLAYIHTFWQFVCVICSRALVCCSGHGWPQAKFMMVTTGVADWKANVFFLCLDNIMAVFVLFLCWNLLDIIEYGHWWENQHIMI